MEFNNTMSSFCNNCRICLAIHHQMIAIQSLKQSTDFNLLLQYFNIEIMTDIRYPNQICIICLDQLNNIVLFKQKCESTFNFLRDSLKDFHGKTEPIENEFLNELNESIKKEDVKPGENAIIINNNSIKIEKSDVKSESDNYEDEEVEIKKNKDYKCQYCDKTFNTKYRYLRHEAIHLKKKFRCDQCSKTFKSNDVFIQHVRTHMGQKSFVCTECSQTFSSSYGLKRHKRSTHGKLNNKRKIEKINIKAEQKEIEINSKITNDYKCQYCDKIFISKTQHLRHENNHLNKSCKCDQCPKTFKNNDLLLRHVRIHLGQKPFACTECLQTFSSSWGLNLHKRNAHSNKPRQKIVCKECGLAVNNMSVHKKYKHSIYEFQCKDCSKRFPFKSALMRHISRSHENGEESFKILCPLCGKMFRTGADLNRHNRNHHCDERNYSCKYCEKLFKTSNVLAKHTQIHLNKRPFKCMYCERGFNDNQTLIGHIRTHTGERPFKCIICSKDFAQKATLRTHIKLVHGRKLNS